MKKKKIMKSSKKIAYPEEVIEGRESVRSLLYSRREMIAQTCT